MEARSWLACGAPDLLGLGRLGSVQGVPPADMASVRVGVPDNGVAGGALFLVAFFHKPFSCALAIAAASFPVVEVEQRRGGRRVRASVQAEARETLLVGRGA